MSTLKTQDLPLYIRHRIKSWSRLLDGPITYSDRMRVADAIKEFESILEILEADQ